MKTIQNTLYITIPDAYISLDGENVVVKQNNKVLNQTPLHLLNDIVVMNYAGITPALMGKCAEKNILVVFLTPNGRFLSRTIGKSYGNVVLRREQYRVSDDDSRSLAIAKNIISAKILNSTQVIRRAISDHGERLDIQKFNKVADALKASSKKAFEVDNFASLRRIEGECAEYYFSVFGSLILRDDKRFVFKNRNRRPPRDAVNAMLSFGYTLMTSICTCALETAGLDSYVGMLHTDRPGRASLSLDLLEEFRAPFVDRFVLTMINKQYLKGDDFIESETGAVVFSDDAKRRFLSEWQKKKTETVTHPYLKEKMQWGMIPFMQAKLLARYIRGDIDDYPPFVWR